MIRKLGLFLVSTIWGALVFRVAFGLSFPSSLAADRISWEVDRATDGRLVMQVGDVSPWGLSGVGLKSLKVLSRAKASSRNSEEGGQPRMLLDAEKLAMRLNLLPLLGGTRSVAIDSDLYGGWIKGAVSQGEKSLGLDVRARELDLSRYTIAGESFSAQLEGLLGARIKLQLDEENLAESKGNIRVSLKDLKVLSASFGGFELLPADFEEAELKLKVEDGRLEVKKGKFISDIMRITVDGDIVLQEQFDRSRLRLKIRFTLSEDLEELAKFVPQMKRARDSDGEYHFQITGNIANWRFREDRSAARGRNTRSTTTPESTKERGGRSTNSSDGDERKRLREDRMKERRERMRKDREERSSSRNNRGNRDDMEREDPVRDQDEEFEDEDELRDGEDDFDDGFEERDRFDDGPMPVRRDDDYLDPGEDGERFPGDPDGPLDGFED